MTDANNLLIDLPVHAQRIALMDIDGCLLNIDIRLPYLLAGDYDTFLAHWQTDRPIPQGLYFYKKLVEDPTIRAIFSTARPENARKITMAQLHHFLGEDAEFELWMCPEKDSGVVGDVELKMNALTRNGVHPSNIFIAFDDRNCIVEAYRRAGIVAYQTDTGY